jgi:ribonucleoside-diphosphate reductase alpha chain
VQNQLVNPSSTKNHFANELLAILDHACRNIPGVEISEIAERTLLGLQEDSTTEDINQLCISNSITLMAEDPNYSKVSARMLAEAIRREVGWNSTFQDFLIKGRELDLISHRVIELAQDRFDEIETAIKHSRDELFEYFGLKTMMDRYLLRNPKSRKLIECPQWLFMRVALGVSQTVDEAIGFYDVISRFYYMPATPTLFNSGTKHPQLSSCYLLTVAQDSLEGIYKSIADCAKLSKFSGGIGIDWTPVRASGTLIRGTNGLSNGIIPFLKVFDSSVHAVNQGGKRKGAAAVYLEPWHADIEAFLELRNNAGAEERRTHHLNLALWVPDLFMKRVEEDAKWSLFSPNDVPELLASYGSEFDGHYLHFEGKGKALRSLPARTLYAKMMQCLAETGNGWICFKDKANLRSAQTGKPGQVIRSSNLCTEILELASAQETAVCNLGSINLISFVNNSGEFDFEYLKTAVDTAVTFLDRVIDINFYPTIEAKTSNQKWRPIGLGIMGLQDVFFKMKLPFVSPEAKSLSAKLSETIYFQAIQTSMRLAKEKGSFPAFSESKYGDGFLQVQLAEQAKQLSPELHYDWTALAESVKTNGIRNSLLIAIAPTATIASIVGSYESIEPQISNLFKRETLSGEFLQINRYLVNDLKSLKLWTSRIRSQIIEANGSIQEIEEIPSQLKQVYKTAWELPQKELIDMAVARSTFVCQAQSLNLFMDNPTVGKLSSMYMYAWKQGIKTTYYLRSRAKTSIQKTTTSVETAIQCSLENPASCEACQ